MAIVVVITALVVNIRHLMYSTAMAPHFSEWPRRSRFLLPYLLTDQSFTLSSDPVADQSTIRSTSAGSSVGSRAGALWLPWLLSTIAGVVLGAQI